LIVISWLVVLVAALGFSSVVGSHYANNFSLPGTDAQRARDLLTTRRRGSATTSKLSPSISNCLEFLVTSKTLETLGDY
jgi:hypothetical protein